MKASLVIAGVAVCFGIALALGVKLIDGWGETERPRASAVPATTTTTSEELPPAQAPTVGPKKAHWLRQVDRLCRQAKAEASRYADTPPASPAEAEKWFRNVLRINARYNERFAALKPVPADRRKVARLLTLLEREERILAGMLAALASGDNEAFIELGARLTSLAQSETDLLVELGADDCGGDIFSAT